MTQVPTIKMPSERIEQLKAIGAALNLPSLGEVAGHLIRAEIARGTIPDTLPGVEIAANPEGVSITIEGSAAATYTNAQASDLAAAIDHAVDGSGSLIDVDADFIVARIGNGIRVSVPLVGEARTFSRDVARDLARLIRAAAAE